MNKIALVTLVLASFGISAFAQVTAGQKADILKEDQRRVESAKALIKADTDSFRLHRKENDVAGMEADKLRVIANLNALKAAAYRLEQDQKLLITK